MYLLYHTHNSKTTMCSLCTCLTNSFPHIHKCMICLCVCVFVSVYILADLTKPRKHNSWYLNVKEKFTFFSRFFYMVLWKGFTPTIFDLLPFPVWYVLTLSIYGYRFTLLPLYLKLIGYGKYVDWNFPPLGSLQPQSHEIRFAPPKLSLSTRDKLSQHNYGDSEFEKMLACLYNKTAHLSPHSQSPGNPLVAGFPGNFMDHLIGVYKILVAWKQPVYVARAGLFHSVYGTFDYRGGCFDLRDGRSQLQNLVGPVSQAVTEWLTLSEISVYVCSTIFLLCFMSVSHSLTHSRPQRSLPF